ncbi:MAG: ketol-acid reductoisomerase [Fimbriimonadaceae bacterium]|nr:ketol-acid reductoisomerase [Fimbriimonadaceae bacterium]
MSVPRLREIEPSTIDPSAIRRRTVAVIGYGSQGRSHALNLRDSGLRTIIGLPSGRASAVTARADGFDVREIPEATRHADVLMLATPDVPMPEIYAEQIAPELRPGQTVLFAHGMTVAFGLIQPAPEIGVGLVAPKGPGPQLRSEYLAGRGLACLVAEHQPGAEGNALDLALGYAWGIGGARRLVLQTTFADEAETDMFGEQAVLCGGLPALVQAGFRTLVDAGYPPELAYFECLHEVKLIADLMIERGIAGMRDRISDTAEWGGYAAGDRLITEATRTEMRKILDEIRNGSFVAGLRSEAQAGYAHRTAYRERDAQDTSEAIGRVMRPKLLGS